MTSCEIGRSIERARTAPIGPMRPPFAHSRHARAVRRRSARESITKKPCFRMWSTTSSPVSRGSIPFTSLTSIVTRSAVDGMTFDACDADARAGHAADVQRWPRDQLIQRLGRLRRSIRARSSLHQVTIDDRCVSERLLLDSVRAAPHRRRSRSIEHAAADRLFMTRAAAPATTPGWAPSCRSARCAARCVGRRRSDRCV